MQSAVASENNQTEESKTQEQHNLFNISFSCKIFLQTLRVKLCNQGKGRVVRIIFDRSYRSYVLKHHTKELDFEIIGEQEIVHMLFGGSRMKPQTHKGYRISVGSLDNSYSCNFVVLNQKEIRHNSFSN